MSKKHFIMLQLLSNHLLNHQNCFLEKIEKEKMLRLVENFNLEFNLYNQPRSESALVVRAKLNG